MHNKDKQYGFGSVKPREAEVLNSENKITKKKLITGLIILAAIILAGLIYGFVRSDLDTKTKEKLASVFNKKEETSENIIVNADNSNTASVSEAASVVLSPNIRVKLALLASPDLFDYKNHPVLGCDALVFAETEIARTPKILNSTLELLFNDNFDYGFPPANFISSTQKNLKFESAVIENGVAKVFLTGKTTIDDKKCDSERIKYQIEQTAKQFSTVKSVEIFLNGDKVEL